MMSSTDIRTSPLASSMQRPMAQTDDRAEDQALKRVHGCAPITATAQIGKSKKQNEKDRDRQQTPQYPAHIPPPSPRLVVHLRLPG
jgi:hypothetical protein